MNRRDRGEDHVQDRKDRFSHDIACRRSSVNSGSVSRRAVAQGEKETQQLLRLMDVDQNGRVSKQEFMQFMEAEFDRLDVDRSGELTVKELSKARFCYSPPHPGGTGSR